MRILLLSIQGKNSLSVQVAIKNFHEFAIEIALDQLFPLISLTPFGMRPLDLYI